MDTPTSVPSSQRFLYPFLTGAQAPTMYQSNSTESWNVKRVLNIINNGPFLYVRILAFHFVVWVYIFYHLYLDFSVNYIFNTIQMSIFLSVKYMKK